MIDRKTMGARIRDLRVRKKMTLKAAEHASGLSSTHLSEIERGRTSPTIGALLRIAAALEVDPSTFIDETERGPFVLAEPEDRTNDRRRSAASDPIPGVAGGRMGWIRLCLPKRGRHDLEEDTEAAGYVLAGRVSLVLPGETVVLACGDSFHDLSPGPRALVNPSDEVARARIVARRRGPR
jgi:transcriptional regulator with XRE-family HTH domain